MLNFKSILIAKLTILVLTTLAIAIFFIFGALSIVAATLLILIIKLLLIATIVISTLVFVTKAYYDFELMMFQYNNYVESHCSPKNKYAHMFS